jgi:hypothetical protein
MPISFLRGSPLASCLNNQNANPVNRKRFWIMLIGVLIATLIMAFSWRSMRERGVMEFNQILIERKG